MCLEEFIEFLAAVQQYLCAECYVVKNYKFCLCLECKFYTLFGKSAPEGCFCTPPSPSSTLLEFCLMVKFCNLSKDRENFVHNSTLLEAKLLYDYIDVTDSLTPKCLAFRP